MLTNKPTSLLQCLFLCFCLIIPEKLIALEYENYEFATLRALNKITAKTSLLKLKLNEAQEFDKLIITLQTCKQTKPSEMPESAAFLEIDEYLPKKLTTKAIFSGWLFASSPSLSAIEHPNFDLWLIGCESKIEASLNEELQSTPLQKR